LNILTARIIGEDFSFSTDLQTGVFGFLNPEISGFAFLYVGLFATVFGYCGYVMSLLFYDPLVVSSSLLFEPFVAQFYGYMLHIDQFPGTFTFIGAFIIILGIVQIDKGSRSKHIK